jgi:hypothetical protein
MRGRPKIALPAPAAFMHDVQQLEHALSRTMPP